MLYAFISRAAEPTLSDVSLLHLNGLGVTARLPRQIRPAVELLVPGGSVCDPLEARAVQLKQFEPVFELDLTFCNQKMAFVRNT